MLEDGFAICRAKALDKNIGWVIGYYVRMPPEPEEGIEPRHMICVFDNNRSVTFRVDSETLCRYTGVMDKNGVRIFEKDIVRKRTRDGIVAKLVRFCDGCFNCGWGSGSSTAFHPYLLTAKEVEVVGNIFDNPSLVGMRYK